MRERRRLPIWLLPLVLAFVGAATVLPLRELDRQPRQEPAQASPDRPAADAGRLQGTKIAPLLPVPRDGLAGFVGRSVLGQGLPVESINGNAGFWVGTAGRNRVYVQWDERSGGDPATRFQPGQGDKVNLAGVAQPAPPDPGRTLRLNDRDAELVSVQRGFVKANTVTRGR